MMMQECLCWQEGSIEIIQGLLCRAFFHQFAQTRIVAAESLSQLVGTWLNFSVSDGVNLHVKTGFSWL